MMMLEVKDDFLDTIKKDLEIATKNFRIGILKENKKQKIYNKGKIEAFERVLRGLGISNREIDLIAINAHKKAKHEFNGGLEKW